MVEVAQRQCFLERLAGNHDCPPSVTPGKGVIGVMPHVQYLSDLSLPANSGAEPREEGSGETDVFERSHNQ